MSVEDAANHNKISLAMSKCRQGLLDGVYRKYKKIS